MQFAREEMSKKSDKKQSLTLFQDQEYDEYWHSKWNQVRRLQEWQEKKNDKKSDNEKKTAEDDISNIKFANMQIWDHLNMRICLLTRRLTIFFEEAWFTIQIIMIHSFMIWIDL